MLLIFITCAHHGKLNKAMNKNTSIYTIILCNRNLRNTQKLNLRYKYLQKKLQIKKTILYDYLHKRASKRYS